MSITLDLPQELERQLVDEAKLLKLPLTEYALRVLRDGPSLSPKLLPTSGMELVEYWRNEGLVGSRPDIEDSIVHAVKLRQEAETRALS